mmetsp:Transcript_12786/g.42191  ORF Transcript_12786/g.42191 Transcript_12786/m.42191 type:complete len:269 (+) Transcript_12786:401-1207(+)
MEEIEGSLRLWRVRCVASGCFDPSSSRRERRWRLFRSLLVAASGHRCFVPRGRGDGGAFAADVVVEIERTDGDERANDEGPREPESEKEKGDDAREEHGSHVRKEVGDVVDVLEDPKGDEGAGGGDDDGDIGEGVEAAERGARVEEDEDGGAAPPRPQRQERKRCPEHRHVQHLHLERVVPPPLEHELSEDVGRGAHARPEECHRVVKGGRVMVLTGGVRLGRIAKLHQDRAQEQQRQAAPLAPREGPPQQKEAHQQRGKGSLAVPYK